MAHVHLEQVGAPDPELDNSPIVDDTEYDEHAGPRDVEIEQGGCTFNGKAYPLGAMVDSGGELLQCTGRGVWVRKGERMT
jgi:hypothetical protein